MTDSNSVLSKPLSDREASRLKTVLWQMKGRHLKLRELTAFSPSEIAKMHNLNAGEIARLAGRRIQEEKNVA